jgi:hypothetical protein
MLRLDIYLIIYTIRKAKKGVSSVAHSSVDINICGFGPRDAALNTVRRRELEDERTYYIVPL